MKIHFSEPGRKNGKQLIKIDPWDTWSMDKTLAPIIAALLKQLQATKHGYPLTDLEDAPQFPDEDETDEWNKGYSEKRWDYILAEMIWAFETFSNDDWEDQFHSGEFDTTWVETKETYDGEKCYEMKHGPNHTHVWDRDGYFKCVDRMKNGFRLFGKYYMNLWD